MAQLVVRALASCNVSLVRFQDRRVICGLILLLVLSLLREVFIPVVFPSPQINNISNFQLDLKSEGHKYVSRKILGATFVEQSRLMFFYLCKQLLFVLAGKFGAVRDSSSRHLWQNILQIWQQSRCDCEVRKHFLRHKLAKLCRNVT